MMWPAAVVMGFASLVLADAGQLSLTNPRLTYGVLGATRPDNRFLPGDECFFAFDIDGIQADAAGRVRYSLSMEILNHENQVIFRQEPKDLEATIPLGGHHLPAFAHIEVGTRQPPGEYTIKVQVTDRSNGATQQVSQACELLPRAFGIVRLATSFDAENRHPAPVACEGQDIWINFGAAGFQRSSAGRANVSVRLRPLDENGQPTIQEPLSGEIDQEVPAQVLALPLQFQLDLNRAGKFTIELEVTDKNSGKSARLSFPVTVVKLGSSSTVNGRP